MNNSRLKECPFCGGTESLRICGVDKEGDLIPVESEGGYSSYIVCCSVNLNRGCGASSRYSPTIAQARAEWNCRPKQYVQTPEESSKPEKFKKIAQELSELYARKNADYGDSFGETFKKLGEVSALTRMSDKLNRAIQLSKAEAQVKDESKIDTLRDLASYAIMYVIELENETE